MAFNDPDKLALQSQQRKERAERRKQAKEEGLFETLEGIEEYYLEIEGYTREEAEPLIERECKRQNIEIEHKTWVQKRIDDVKVVFALVKEHPEEAKLIGPMIVTGVTALSSFALGALSQDKNKPAAPQDQQGQMQEIEPLDRSKIRRLSDE